MDRQNLAYAATQIIHNLGAVAAVSDVACTLAWREATVQHRLAWTVLIGWATQAASGAALGAISFYRYGKFPDIHGIAVVAPGRHVWLRWYYPSSRSTLAVMALFEF